MAFWGSGHWGYISHGMMPKLPKFTRMGFRRFLGEPREVRGEQVPMLMRLLLIFASYVSKRWCKGFFRENPPQGDRRPLGPLKPLTVMIADFPLQTWGYGVVVSHPPSYTLSESSNPVRTTI